MMSDGKLHPLFLLVAVVTMSVICCTVWFAANLRTVANGNTAEVDRMKVECILHRDNPDVHKLCIDHGYDK